MPVTPSLIAPGSSFSWRAWSRTADRNSAAVLGGAASPPGVSSTCGESGQSIARAIRFAEATPSASAWCTLPITATRSGARPSAKYSTQSGRRRLKGRAGDLADQIVKAPPTAGRGHLYPPHVVIHVDGDVLAPHRPVQVEGNIHQLIAQGVQDG